MEIHARLRQTSFEQQERPLITRTFTTSAHVDGHLAAPEQRRTIDDHGHAHVQGHRHRSVPGEALTPCVRALPALAGMQPGAVLRADLRSAYGFEGDATSATTPTRPDPFAQYYLEPSRLFLEKHGYTGSSSQRQASLLHMTDASETGAAGQRVEAAA